MYSHGLLDQTDVHEAEGMPPFPGPARTAQPELQRSPAHRRHTFGPAVSVEMGRQLSAIFAPKNGLRAKALLLCPLLYVSVILPGICRIREDKNRLAARQAAACPQIIHFPAKHVWMQIVQS